MEARVELVCSGDRTRTSCTHERTCVGAANALNELSYSQLLAVKIVLLFYRCYCWPVNVLYAIYKL